MDESGIDMGFDLTAAFAVADPIAHHVVGDYDDDDFEQALSLLSTSTKELMYYELKSRAPDTGSPPTFKTATPTSRTQLKLQLMREQLQEQERRQAEFRQSLQQQRPAAAPPRPVPPTPLPTIGVDVPPQVLQVRTLLENPTRYHVVQKQKNQVRQYLHESFRGGEGGNAVVSGSAGSEGGGRTPVDAGPPPVPMVVQSAPPGPQLHHPKPQHPHLASYPHAPALLPHHSGNPTVVSASPTPTATGTMSPGLSSVATSNSEVGGVRVDSR